MILHPNSFLVFSYFQLKHFPQLLWFVYLVTSCEPLFQVVGQSDLEFTYYSCIDEDLWQVVTKGNCMLHEKLLFSFFFEFSCY